MSEKVPVKVKLTVGKGLSLEVSKDRWRKVNYKLELELEVQTIEQVEVWKEKAEATIDKWIGKHTGAAKPSPPSVVPGGIPQLDIAEIQALPWKAKNKELAGKGGWAWLFSDVKEIVEKHDPKDRALVLELCRAIRGSENKLQLGDMIYSYAKNTKFLNRVPAKRDSAH